MTAFGGVTWRSTCADVLITGDATADLFDFPKYSSVDERRAAPSRMSSDGWRGYICNVECQKMLKLQQTVHAVEALIHLNGNVSCRLVSRRRIFTHRLILVHRDFRIGLKLVLRPARRLFSPRPTFILEYCMSYDYGYGWSRNLVKLVQLLNSACGRLSARPAQIVKQEAVLYRTVSWQRVRGWFTYLSMSVHFGPRSLRSWTVSSRHKPLRSPTFSLARGDSLRILWRSLPLQKLEWFCYVTVKTAWS